MGGGVKLLELTAVLSENKGRAVGEPWVGALHGI